MLPTSRVVKSVYLDTKSGILAGVLAASKSGIPKTKLIMEYSTIQTATIKTVAEAAEKTSSKLLEALTFVDAPVLGGLIGAKAGTLTFIVGCLPATLA